MIKKNVYFSCITLCADSRNLWVLPNSSWEALTVDDCFQYTILIKREKKKEELGENLSQG